MNAFDAIAGWKLKAMLAGVAVLAVCGVFAFFHHLGVKAQAERDAPVIAKLQSDLGACHADVAFRDDRIASQNRDIQSLAEQAEVRAEKAAAAVKAAQTEANLYRRRANRIAGAQAGPDQCASANDLITTTLSEERAQ